VIGMLAPSEEYMRRLIFALLVLFTAMSLLAQKTPPPDPDYDTDKPLPSSCGEPVPLDDEPPPPPQFDEPINDRNPDLGFYPPKLGTQDPEKAASETCPWDETAPDAWYEKVDADDAQRVMAPCAWPSSITVQAGLRDFYAQPQDAANLTQTIINAVGQNLLWANFDNQTLNRHFGHTFTPAFLLPAFYRTGLLTIHLTPLNDNLQGNDTISIWVQGGTGGWSASLASLGATTPGREATLQLDLRTLLAGNSTILADLRQFGNLHVYIQDDTSVDDMELRLSCDDTAVPVPLVGVIQGGSSCGTYSRHEVYLDNEDSRNANNRSGWIGQIVSDKNTRFRFCAVDGTLFTAAANAGANFALVSFSPSCPSGFTRFDRYHDNEDNRPQSSDTAPSGSPTTTIGSAKNTNMAFCVANGLASIPNSTFPNLGISYGVFGGRNVRTSPWVLARGGLHLDDEDNRNANSTNPGTFPYDWVVGGKNTDYFVSRVK
jgi:hypothetical protein